MPINSLTDAKCKAARAKEKAVKLFDGNGLYLFVSPTGAKTWRKVYYVSGKQRQISLGSYPLVTLAACSATGDAALAVFSECADQYREMAATADECTNERDALIAAWPIND
jgi:hypothetical protein